MGRNVGPKRTPGTGRGPRPGTCFGPAGSHGSPCTTGPGAPGGPPKRGRKSFENGRPRGAQGRRGRRRKCARSMPAGGGPRARGRNRNISTKRRGRGLQPEGAKARGAAAPRPHVIAEVTPEGSPAGRRVEAQRGWRKDGAAKKEPDAGTLEARRPGARREHFRKSRNTVSETRADRGLEGLRQEKFRGPGGPGPAARPGKGRPLVEAPEGLTPAKPEESKGRSRGGRPP